MTHALARWLAAAVLGAAGLVPGSPAWAADAAPPASAPAGKAMLPQDDPYQKTLRDFMATLKEADFLPTHKDLAVVPVEGDADAKLRMWMQSLSPPAVGRKRNHSSVMIKPGLFTLESIEGGAEIMRPPAHPEPLVDLADWNYPGNTYHDSRPLRLRAFALVALDMVMLDQLLAKGDPKTLPNQDQLASFIARAAYVYPGVRKVIPNGVREAYLAGLRKLVLRALAHGPKPMGGRTQGMYTFAVPALALASQALDDAAITKQVEAYARQIYTNPRFFSPAGYFPQGGTLDSFNGICVSFAMWGAFVGDWDFAREAMAKFYRLKAHLTLPEPDGTLIGPSHWSSLTPPDPFHDQWTNPARWAAAGLLTDEAACFVKWPTPEVLDKAPEAAVAEVNTQLHELSWAPNGLDPAPWRFAAVGPLTNPGYQHYRRGFAAHLASLAGKEMSLLPVARPGGFVRTFGEEFLVAKRQGKAGSHAAILHYGPIADTADADSGLGLGGGALSAFWTPETGSVILGRGVGAWSPRYAKMFENWRVLPSHAVMGITAEGKVFTSARIVQPQKKLDAGKAECTLEVHAPIPTERRGAGTLLNGTLEYARKFESTPEGLRVTTTLSGDGKDSIAELYEVIPVFLRDVDAQRTLAPTTIEFKAGGAWTPATTDCTEQVSSIRLTRFGHAVEITFDKPRRVKLAPADWDDSYMVHALCRNLLIDLLESGDKPATVKEARSVSYKIEPAGP